MTNDEVVSSNFLIPPDENVHSGKTLAEFFCDSLKDFNPMVCVSVEKGFYFHFILLNFAFNVGFHYYYYYSYYFFNFNFMVLIFCGFLGHS